jgi:hypothetical protein
MLDLPIHPLTRYFKSDAETENERRLITDGKYSNNSRYVRIVMSENVEKRRIPQTSLPFGFRGMELLKTNDTLTDDPPDVNRMAGYGSSIQPILPPVPFRFKVTKGNSKGSSSTFFGDPGSLEKVVLTDHAKNPTDMSVSKTLQKIKPNIFANGGDRNKKNAADPKSSLYTDIAMCKKIKCKKLFQMYADDELDLHPPYQRESGLWSRSKKEGLIDTIIRNYDMPKIYLRRPDVIRVGGGKDEVLDGQQRLSTVFALKEGNLTYKGKYWADLPTAIQKRINNYKIDVTIMKMTEEQARTQFAKLQEGLSLNGQEKRNAAGGQLNDKIKALAMSEFFPKTALLGSITL